MRYVPFILWFAAFIATTYGWVENIALLVGDHVFSGLMVARVVGIFIVPVGAILGYV